MMRGLMDRAALMMRRRRKRQGLWLETATCLTMRGSCCWMETWTWMMWMVWTGSREQVGVFVGGKWVMLCLLLFVIWAVLEVLLEDERCTNTWS